jgi:hypothetical protein
MSHVLDNGLMLVTKNAFHALESSQTDDSKKISYGEIDTWVEGLRKVLYSHIRTEMAVIDAAIPVILNKVHRELGVTKQAELEGLASLLRGLVQFTYLSTPTSSSASGAQAGAAAAAAAGAAGQEMGYADVISFLERHFERDADFRHTLNKYKHSAVIFIPLRSQDKHGGAMVAAGRRSSSSSSQRPSSAVASTYSVILVFFLQFLV